MNEILKEIRRRDVLFAIEQLDKYKWHSRNNSTKFDMVYEGKAYPPKMVIRYAGLHATGEEPVAFGGGKDSNDLLVSLGFTVVEKSTGNVIGGSLSMHSDAKREEEDAALHDIVVNSELSETEKDTLIKARIGQGAFRKDLFTRSSKCALCGVSTRELLLASHIKPWRSCESYERLDLDNGLLLCPNHDWLFDKGYITFTEDGTLLISSKLPTNDQVFMNIMPSMQIRLTPGQIEYMEWHRENLFQE